MNVVSDPIFQEKKKKKKNNSELLSVEIFTQHTKC